MLNFESSDELILPDEIENRFKELEKAKRDQIVTTFSERITDRLFSFTETGNIESEEDVKEVIIQLVEEILNEVDTPIDNWKNGLDLL